MPLYVMVATSLKDTGRDPQRQPALAAHQRSTFDAWAKAWGSACTGIDCGGLQALLLQLAADGGAGGAVSTAIGAINGYVLSKWRFRGSETDVRACCCSACSCRCRWCCCR